MRFVAFEKGVIRMTRRTGLVVVGSIVLGGSFGVGTALATAQTTSPSGSTRTTQTSTSPTTATSTPHTCPHRAGTSSD